MQQYLKRLIETDLLVKGITAHARRGKPIWRGRISTPQVHVIRNPARLGWKPIVTVEHYACDTKSILAAEEGKV